MKGMRSMILLTAVASPAWAIEPPVKARPIEPSAPDHSEAAQTVAGDEFDQAPRPRIVRRPDAGRLPGRADSGELSERTDPGQLSDRAYLGVILSPLPALLAGHLGLAEGEGVVVGKLVTDGPAERAGLKVNDVIVAIGGQSVSSAVDMRRLLAGHEVGDEVDLEVIQSGERRTLRVELGATLRRMPGTPPAGHGFGGTPSEEFESLLQQLPEHQAELLRRQMERSLRSFEDIERQAGAVGLQRELLRRMERGFGGIQDGMPEGVRPDFHSESTIRLMDDQGSIELKTLDGDRQAKVFDGSGELLWEGRYNSEQDLAEVPEEIRSRLERMNFNIDGNGLRFHLGPQRFRRLEELDRR